MDIRRQVTPVVLSFVSRLFPPFEGLLSVEHLVANFTSVYFIRISYFIAMISLESRGIFLSLRLSVNSRVVTNAIIFSYPLSTFEKGNFTSIQKRET